MGLREKSGGKKPTLTKPCYVWREEGGGDALYYDIQDSQFNLLPIIKKPRFYRGFLIF